MCVSPLAVKKLDLARLVDRLNGHEDGVARAVYFAYLSNATRPKATRWKDVQGLSDLDLPLFRDRLAVCPDPDPVVGLVVRAGCAARGAGPLLDDAELAALGKRPSLEELFVRQPNCPVERLQKLADDGELGALHHPRFPVEKLIELSRSPEHAVRTTVAQQASLPLEQVTALAHDPSAFVRQALARRDDLPEALAKLLAEDPVQWVREARASAVERLQPQRLDDAVLAADPNLPPDVARVLATNESMKVRSLLALNPALPPDVLAGWLAGTVEERLLAVQSRALTPTQMETLVADPDARVRSLVLRNPLLTTPLRAQLERDPDDVVRHEWAAWARSEPEMIRIVEALPEDQLAEHLFEGMLSRWVPPAVAVAMARRRNPDADACLKERIDLCPEAWRVMLYG